MCLSLTSYLLNRFILQINDLTAGTTSYLHTATPGSYYAQTVSTISDAACVTYTSTFLEGSLFVQTITNGTEGQYIKLATSNSVEGTIPPDEVFIGTVVFGPTADTEVTSNQDSRSLVFNEDLTATWFNADGSTPTEWAVDFLFSEIVSFRFPPPLPRKS